jgi:hypothetical protein
MAKTTTPAQSHDAGAGAQVLPPAIKTKTYIRGKWRIIELDWNGIKINGKLIRGFAYR